MATTTAGTRNRYGSRTSIRSLLDRDLAVARRPPPPRGHPAHPSRRGLRRDAVFVDEHEGGDQLALSIEEVHLSGGRDHVRERVANARAQLVDQLDDALAVPAHGRTSGFFAAKSTRGNVISRR